LVAAGFGCVKSVFPRKIDFGWPQATAPGFHCISCKANSSSPHTIALYVTPQVPCDSDRASHVSHTGDAVLGNAPVSAELLPLTRGSMSSASSWRPNLRGISEFSETFGVTDPLLLELGSVSRLIYLAFLLEFSMPPLLARFLRLDNTLVLSGRESINDKPPRV
jgi:hypothetical protein